MRTYITLSSCYTKLHTPQKTNQKPPATTSHVYSHLLPSIKVTLPEMCQRQDFLQRHHACALVCFQYKMAELFPDPADSCVPRLGQ